jgi:hypothetical protein
MVSSRFFASALCGALSFSSFAAARPAAAAVATIARSTVAAQVHQRSQGLQKPAPFVARNYSVNNTEPLPDSRIWEFKELKKLVDKDRKDRNVTIVGMCHTHP